MSQLAKWLAPYRQSESSAHTLGLSQSPDSMRILAAWPMARLSWRAPRGREPKSEPQLWIWIWKGLSFDLDALALATRLNPQTAYSILRALVAARAVYPDGTISGPAAKLLGASESAPSGMAKSKGKGKAGRPKGARDKRPRQSGRSKKAKTIADKAASRDRGALSRPCPMCGVRPGERCQSATGKPLRSYYHAGRLGR